MGIETILTLIIAPAATALAAAVTALWRQSNKTHTNVIERLSAKLDECEDDTDTHHEWAVCISERVGKLEGIVETQSQKNQEVTTFCDQIIQRLDKF